MNFLFKFVVLIVCCFALLALPSMAIAKDKDASKKATAAKNKKKTNKKKAAETKKVKAKGKEINFSFSETKLKLKITKSPSATAGVEFKGVEARDDHSAVMNFATPQLSEQTTTKVPALLLTEFDGDETLKHDIREFGYASEPKAGDAGMPRQLPLPRGYLYFWTTPTMGSANYYYLQHPQEKNIAIRIGPIPGMVDKDFTIDWAGARWAK